MRRVLLFIFFCYLSSQAQAQLSVRGKVSNAQGEVLPGVTIVVKGKTTSAATTASGTYVIAVPSATDTLVFSYIGFQKTEMPVNGRQTIDVVLESATSGLDEVVVVGYGQQKKTTLAGAVSSISGKEIAATKNQNLQNMLTGKLPGVRVIQQTSEPGTFDNKFDIRGMGDPLVIIDGVPRGNSARIDPNEVESISILKDASAAIYGARAANGVVLITTRTGAGAKAQIEYSFRQGFQQPTGLPEPLNALDRFTIFNERGMHNIDAPLPAYSDDIIKQFQDGTRKSTDYYDMTMHKFAPESQHNLSASGSSENKKISYFFNLGYSNQTGFWKTDDLRYRKYNVRSNISASISKSLKASLNIGGLIDQQDRPYRDSWEIFKNLWRSHPDDPFYANDNPKYLNQILADWHPGAITSSDISGFRKNINRQLQSTVTLDYTVPFVEGLSLKGMFAYDAYMTDNTWYQKEFNVYAYNPTNSTYIPKAYQGPNRLNRNYGFTPNTLMQFSANYQRVFGKKHDVRLLGVYEEETNKGDGFMAQRELTIQLPYLFAGNSLNQQGSNSPGNVFEVARKAFIGRVNYVYDGKYIVEASFRADGSSKYPPSSKWGFFPSGLVAWRISEEGFFKNSSSLSFIQNLKLRASYGVLGNDGGLNFQHITGYDYPAGGNPETLPNGYYFDGWTNALGFRVLPTPDFSWFEARFTNIGLDADLWNGQLGVVFEIFRRDGNGIPANKSVSFPASFGAVLGQQNLNSDRTQGMELQLTHRNSINRDLHYSINGNIALTRTMNRYVERARDGNSYLNWRNNPNERYNDVWFGYGYVGQYQSYDQISKFPVYTSRNVLPGDYIYEDWNNDGVIDDMDRYPIATTISPGGDFNQKKNYPLLTFGLTLGLDYKGFDLNMLFQGGGMSYVAYGELYQTISENALEFFMDRWHPADPKKDPYDPTNTWIPGYNAYTGTTYDINSERGIQNGAYMRLKSAELGYTLPSTLTRKAGINNLRVYVNGYNVLTFTGVKGADPEHSSNLYGYMYPLNKTYNVGASVRF